MKCMLSTVKVLSVIPSIHTQRERERDRETERRERKKRRKSFKEYLSVCAHYRCIFEDPYNCYSQTFWSQNTLILLKK